MKKNNQDDKKIKLSFNQVFRSIRDKISKIISFKIKENKTLNETEFIIRGETKMTDGIVKKGKAKTKKVPELHPELKQFIEDQNKRWEEQRKFNKSQNEKWEEQAKFNKSQNEKWEEQIKFNKQMQETNQAILSSIQEILLRIQRIEKCPTIKKELDELE